MKFNKNINLPQKSLFGFKVLSSLQSTFSCYLLLLIGKFLNPLFGSEEVHLITGSLFNIVLNLSIVILIVNITIKRKELKKIYFIFLNLFLYLYLPIALYLISKYMVYLIYIIF
jgi:hypothetical protein